MGMIIYEFFLYNTGNASASHGTVYFLFLVENKLLNELVWDEYFKYIPDLDDSSKSYRVLIHSSKNDSFFPPTHFESIVVNTVSSTTCENVVGAMNGLLEAALGHTVNDAKGNNIKLPPSNDKDVFIFLSMDTIPVKPFNELADYFFVKSTQGQAAESSFCISPVDEWEVAGDANPPSKYAVKHSQWYI